MFMILNFLKQKHSYPDEITELTCFDCSQTFTSAENLQQHMNTHTNSTQCVKAEKFECDVCQEIFFGQVCYFFFH